MEYGVRVVRDEAGLDALQDGWGELLGGSPAATIFASHGWNTAWWQSFGKGKRLYVVVAQDGEGHVRGIAPLMMRAGPVRRLEFIGTGLSDTGDFVLEEESAEEVTRAIFAFLRRHRREWDLLDLDEVPPYSHLAEWLGKGKPSGLHMIILPRTDCPYIVVPVSWEAYVKGLQRKARQHLEGFARRIIEETGATFRLVTEDTTEDNLQDAVARFYLLHRMRWADKEDELNPEHRATGFLPFLEEVCRQSAANGYLRLAEVHVGDRVIGSCIGFQVNGRWNGYMTGFDPQWGTRRPGKLLHGYVMRQALAEKTREFDFGRGREGYKYELGAVDRTNARLLLTNNMPRSILALAMTRARIMGREVVRRYRKSKQEKED
jgi:CelD/BcsL family acetyltransferase involved in cellulose biosynthesis